MKGLNLLFSKDVPVHKRVILMQALSVVSIVALVSLKVTEAVAVHTFIAILTAAIAVFEVISLVVVLKTPAWDKEDSNNVENESPDVE